MRRLGGPGPGPFTGQTTLTEAPFSEAGLTKDRGVRPVQGLLGEGHDPKVRGARPISRTGSWERVWIPANLLVLMGT